MILAMTNDDYLVLLDSAAKDLDATIRRWSMILTRLHDGWSPPDISQFVGCARSSVYRVIARYQEGGLAGLHDQRKDPTPRKATPEYLVRVVDLLKARPQDLGWARSTWSCELLSLQMAKETGIQLHPDHLNRLIRNGGARYRRPRPVVRPFDPRSANERLTELIETVKAIEQDEVLVCQDEVDINLNQKIGPMWMMKGQQAEVRTPGINVKRYLAGSVSMRTGELVWVEGERKKSALFVKWVDKIAEHYADAPAIHVILDNARIHDSGITQRAVAKHGGRIKLHFLPSYCPACNFMEHVWLQLHANVTRNHSHPTIEELMAAVHAFMQAASPFPGSLPSLARIDVAS
jgi:transposase